MARLFIGNLPYTLTTAQELAQICAELGVTVQNPHVVTDRETGMGKGFGFVEVPDKLADDATAILRGARVAGRLIRVDKANARRHSDGGGAGERYPDEPARHDNSSDRNDRRRRS